MLADLAKSKKLPLETKFPMVAVSFAAMILAQFFDDTWINKFIFPSSRGEPFAQTPVQGSGLDWHNFSNRIIDLAELIMNLQWKEGFDYCLTQLSGGQIQSTMAEMETAQMLCDRGVPFKFTAPQKGNSYDFEVETVDDEWIPSEIKLRKIKFETSGVGVRNLINDARKQLPKTRPGFVFIRYDEASMWPLNQEKADKYTATKNDIARIVKSSGRIASVKIFTRINMRPSHKITFRAFVGEEILNTNCRFRSPNEWRIFDDNRSKEKWTYLEDFVHGYPVSERGWNPETDGPVEFSEEEKKIFTDSERMRESEEKTLTALQRRRDE